MLTDRHAKKVKEATVRYVVAKAATGCNLLSGRMINKKQVFASNIGFDQDL